MANTTSGTTIFEKGFSIADIVEEAYERIGISGASGYQLKGARRSLNIMFQEWGNRGLHYWEVNNTSFTLATNQKEYQIFRSSSEGDSSGVTTTLTTAITSDATTTIPVGSVTNMPTSGKIKIDNEIISYTGISGLNLTGGTRGADGTTITNHLNTSVVTNFVNGADDILEASFRNSDSVDTPLTKINRSTYQALSNKTSTGQPTQYFVQRFIDKITVTLYLTPGSDQAGKFLNYYYVKRIQDAGDYTNDADVPYRFVPCMVAGLAYYLAVKYSPEKIQMLKMLYEDELNRALQEDGSSSSSFITPKTYYPGV